MCRQRHSGAQTIRAQPVARSTLDRDGQIHARNRHHCLEPPPPVAARIAHAVRAQWGTENGMHWTLDMAFGENQCRGRVNNAALNFATLRRIVMNLLRQDCTTNVGLKNRRMLACANDRYLAQLLG